MRVRNSLRTPLLLTGLLAATEAARGDEPARPPAAGSPVAHLVEQLGSRTFAERERASRQLKDLDHALPALKKALQSPDAEVRCRAGRALAVIAGRMLQQSLRRIIARGKTRDLDVLIDAVVAGKHTVGDDAWRAVQESVRAVSDRANRGGSVGTTLADISTLPMTTGEAVTAVRSFYRQRLIAESFSASTVSGAAIVCRGEVRVRSSIRDSVVFANGSVQVGRMIRNSVIVCDGDIVVDKATVSNSVLIATGGVKVSEDSFNTLIRESEPIPSPFLNLFDPARVGVKVGPAEGGVRVKEIVAGKPFARAGVKSGDRIVALDDAEVPTPQAFRQLLRRKVAEGQPTWVTLQRGEFTLEVSVSLGE